MTTTKNDSKKQKIPMQRVQSGIRVEKRLLKVVKALAEYFDITLGDLLEGIVLHAFKGKSAFSEKNIKVMIELKKFMDSNMIQVQVIG